MRAIAFSTFSLAVLGIIPFAVDAQGQGKEAIQKKLEAEYQLTKTNYDKSDIVTAGSVIVLQKDKVLMLLSSSTNPCRNTYKNGNITQSGPCRANEKLKRFSQLTAHIPGSSNVPDSSSHTFVTGEKFWVTRIEVRDTGKEPGIVFDFFSDAINDNRYSTTLLIPFGASTPGPDDALKLVREVITVAPTEEAKDAKGDKAEKGDKQPSAPQGGQPAPPAPEPVAAAKEAAPAPIEPPPPPPPDPTNISEGQSIEQVVAALGQPAKKAKVGTKDIYYYKDLKITFVNGKVKDVQ